MATLSPHVLAIAELEDAKVAITFHPATKEEARALIQRIGGHFEKSSYDGTYWVTQRDEPPTGCHITIFIPSMCTRVKVGERDCPAISLPATTVPQYEYQCEQLFEVE